MAGVVAEIVGVAFGVVVDGCGGSVDGAGGVVEESSGEGLEGGVSAAILYYFSIRTPPPLKLKGEFAL